MDGGRTRAVTVRLTEEEYQGILADCANLGGITSPRRLVELWEWARSGGGNGHGPSERGRLLELLVTRRSELSAVAGSLGKAASNVNQIARVANATNAIPVRQLEETQRELAEALGWLRALAGPDGEIGEAIAAVAGERRRRR